ncbi:MAG: ABC transporter permease subunit [Spirochaetales bacterium]|nr:ABC transporter permease subunit [Spirochaetales bacterium]
MDNIKHCLEFTIGILVSVSLTNLIIGTSVGVWLANKKTVFSRILETLITLPLIFPPIAFGFFMISLLGRDSLIGYGLLKIFNVNIIFSQYGVFLGSFISGFPLMVKSVKTSALSIDQSIMEMARIQGANQFDLFLYILLPNLSKGICAGMILSASRSLGEVGMCMLLGGNIQGKTETISLAIFNAVFEGDIMKATLLSTILIVISLLFFTLISQFEKEDENVQCRSFLSGNTHRF